MHVNETLARGLRRQQIAQDYVNLAVVADRVKDKMERGCQRRVPTFKRGIAEFRRQLVGYIYDDTLSMDKKRSQYGAVLWTPNTDGRANIISYQITARDLAAQVLYMSVITAHCIERLYQRLNTTRLQDAMQELRPVATGLWAFVTVPVDEWPDELHIETENGVARLVADKGQRDFKLVTWILK